MAARGFLGAGDVYLARYDATAGKFLDFTGPYETDQLEIKPNVERKEMTSKGHGTYGQTLESVSLPTPSDLTIVLKEVTGESLGMALLGKITEINQAAGTITDEEVVLSNGFVKLSKGNLSATGLTVTDDTGATTYVINDDYVVNYRTGMIKRVEGGAIASGDTVQVSASYNALTGSSIAGSTLNEVRVKVLFDGKNMADQSQCNLEIYDASLSPDQGVDFLSSDFASVTLTGQMKTPVGKTEPYRVDVLDQAL